MKIERFLTKGADLKFPTYSKKKKKIFCTCPLERLLNLGSRRERTIYVYSV